MCSVLSAESVIQACSLVYLGSGKFDIAGGRGV